MSNLKIESARRQLGTALWLYLRDEDPVSVHCLAGGGCEMIEHFAKKAGAKPFSSYMLRAHPDLDIAKLKSIQRKFWNAFKHATHQGGEKERNDDDLLKRFSDEQNDHALFIGWYDYANATNSLPVEAQAHQVWYIALYPEKLDPKHSIERYQTIFPRLRGRPRAEQKQMLNRIIEKVRNDPNVMEDPMTDKRPLVIEWKPGEFDKAQI
jgi:hypothetical protein